MIRSIFEDRRLATLLLVGAVLWSVAAVPWGDRMTHPGGWGAIGEILGAMGSPELSRTVSSDAISATWATIAYAVAGLTLALVVAVPLGIFASGVLSRSDAKRRTSTAAVRLVLAFFRSVHELVWAWLFVAAVGLSPMAAVLALGIAYGGILGRIYSELLQDVPEGPLRALRSSGASEWRVLWYGRLPMALPDMLSYTFYRLECGIRSAAIMSFIGLGGLGHEVRLALDDLAYGRMWTHLYFLAGLIVIVDVWSTMVRRRVAA
jgi:phosphonate transport system permease protein